MVFAEVSREQTSRDAMPARGRQQEVCITPDVRMRPQDARVAILLNGQSQPPRDPPDNGIPWHERTSDCAGKQESRVTTRGMLEFMGEQQLL